MLQRELPCGAVLTWPGERPLDIGWCPEGTDRWMVLPQPDVADLAAVHFRVLITKPEMGSKPYLLFFSGSCAPFLLANKGFRFFKSGVGVNPKMNSVPNPKRGLSTFCFLSIGMLGLFFFGYNLPIIVKLVFFSIKSIY